MVAPGLKSGEKAHESPGRQRPAAVRQRRVVRLWRSHHLLRGFHLKHDYRAEVAEVDFRVRPKDCLARRSFWTPSNHGLSLCPDGLLIRVFQQNRLSGQSIEAEEQSNGDDLEASPAFRKQRIAVYPNYLPSLQPSSFFLLLERIRPPWDYPNQRRPDSLGLQHRQKISRFCDFFQRASKTLSDEKHNAHDWRRFHLYDGEDAVQKLLKISQLHKPTSLVLNFLQIFNSRRLPSGHILGTAGVSPQNRRFHAIWR
jgi:hypothetical protein